MSDAATCEVELLGNTVSYSVRRSTGATEPRIDVDIHGIRVVLPEGSSDDPAEFLAENAAWVVEKKAKYDQYRENVPERDFVEGAFFPYLGEDHEIVIERRSASAVAGGTIRLAEHHVEQTSVKRALESLYRRKAREIFSERTEHYSNVMGVSYKKIEIRNQRTKWGSCSTSGTLGLNWRLMMAPSDVIDYIVIHELAHLIEPSHSRHFWTIVREHQPSYIENAHWLEENSIQLIFCRDDL